MGLKRWSLDRLTTWIGTMAVLVLFVPTGVYLIHSVSSSAEQNLAKYGKSLVNTLAGQIIEPLLLGDRLALYNALGKAASADGEVRYLCIESEDGDILVGSPARGYPPALSRLWREHPGEVILFRSEDGPLMDVSTPLLGGHLGTLHAGMSRSRTSRSGDRLFWLLGVALVMTLSVVLVVARVITISVGRPLHQLEAAVSLYPQRPINISDLKVFGTSEVESLAKGFIDMVRRLDLFERDRAATQERMIHTERLAALGELAAGLAHEVNNPLDGMQECLRYLQRDPNKSSRADKYYPMLSEGMQRIASAMREMLTFARSGQNTSIVEYRIAEVVNASQLLVEANIGGAGVDISWRLPEDCVCMCDSHGLAQVLLNLVLNAAEAAQDSSHPQVKIEATYDRQWANISVELTLDKVSPKSLIYREFIHGICKPKM